MPYLQEFVAQAPDLLAEPLQMWKQQVHYGKSAFIKFGNPDFVKLAESMGLKGYRIESAIDLVPTLKEALDQKVPTIIDCPVDYRENILFTRKSTDQS